MYHQSGFSQTLYVSDHTEMKITDSFGSAFQVHMNEYTCDPTVYNFTSYITEYTYLYFACINGFIKGFI